MLIYLFTQLSNFIFSTYERVNLFGMESCRRDQLALY